jgi:hypothetical protein
MRGQVRDRFESRASSRQHDAIPRTLQVLDGCATPLKMPLPARLQAAVGGYQGGSLALAPPLYRGSRVRDFGPSSPALPRGALMGMFPGPRMKNTATTATPVAGVPAGGTMSRSLVMVMSRRLAAFVGSVGEARPRAGRRECRRPHHLDHESGESVSLLQHAL